MEKEDLLLGNAKSIITKVTLEVIKKKVNVSKEKFDAEFWKNIYYIAKKYRTM
ncbi:hypothetical protein HUK49_05145 [Limosilactobacillus sp. c11Ua_112_M]|uniref:hypothetical protein n=1 Tax=Limosilactobacillus portuensis TaxID=2742601 RepID=UPI00177A95CE|nr:hypothetical protein [Limosilactobacillus portuensis]MBD8087342.1 hypothetical protein [Limosilactobacillus portuensis]